MTTLDEAIAASTAVTAYLRSLQNPGVTPPPPPPPPPEPPVPPVVPPPGGTFRKVLAYDAPVPTVVGEPWKRDISGDVTDCVSISFVPPAGMESLRLMYAQMPTPRTTFYSLSTMPANFEPAFSLDNRGGRSTQNASIAVSTTGRAGHIRLLAGQRYYFNVRFAGTGSFAYEFKLELQN